MRRRSLLTLLLAWGLLAGCSGGAGTPKPGQLPPLADSTLEGEGLEPIEPAPPLAEGGPRLIVSSKGVVLPVLGPVEGGFRVVTPCGNQVVANGTPLTAIDVVIDPGHGGEESGAVGPRGLQEKDLNLVVAAHAARALQAQDVSVLLTRRADYRMTLASRGLVVEAIRPKVFVSIHHNAGATAPSAVGPGTEVYHQQASPESKRLSGLVFEDVKGYLASAKNVSWVAGERPGVVARIGAKGDDYYGMLRRTKGTPAALIEGAFISNGSEEALLQRKEVQKAEGEAIARAIVRYLRSPAPGSGYVAPFTSSAPAGGGGGAQSCEDPRL